MLITSIYGGLLGLWFLILSVRVIKGRGRGISIGDGGDAQMLRLMRGHANFAEYTPMILVLIAMAEYQGMASIWIHAWAACLLIGRVLHGYTFCFHDNFPPGRVGGTVLTFIALLGASLSLLWMAIQRSA